MEHPVLANFGDVDIGPGRVDDDVFGLGVFGLDVEAASTIHRQPMGCLDSPSPDSFDELRISLFAT